MDTSRDNGLVVIQLRMALACILLAVLGGLVAVLHYIPSVSEFLTSVGLPLAKLRPLHTSFASLWIFGAAIAVIYHWLSGKGLSRADTLRFRFHTALWILAGLGIFITLSSGVFSGREYLGFHPVFSAALLLGWLAFAFNFLRRALPGFWRAPVYIWFWTAGVLYFIYTFVEGHAYLLPWVEESPIRDLQLQWKSCGTLVGSFNFLVYGSLIYVAEKLSGDRGYGQSRIAFLLFGVGALNSFTNFAHHTYHLPQSHTVKWIAFIVSMVEILILLRILWDISRAVRARVSGVPFVAATAFLGAAKWWTAAMLIVSIAISVPSLNSLIHGTHMVTGHAMGTEIGIDTMILFGALSFLLAEIRGSSETVAVELNSDRKRRMFVLLNLSTAVLVAWLSVSGVVHGVCRYMGEANPGWVSWGKIIFPLAGAGVAMALTSLARGWWQMLASPAVPDSDAEPSSAG